MFSLKKKLSPEENVTAIGDSQLKERLFFHDIINQTHGLILYLGQKELSGIPVDPSEVKMLLNEVKTLQSLIRDHYNFKHKNLIQTYDWVPLSYAQMAFAHLAHTYLSDSKITSTFKVEDETAEGDLIYYPCFYRIMNNLIKNIAESGPGDVEFEFTLKGTGFFITTKNLMPESAAENEIPEYLSRVILSEKSNIHQGLGLESIHHLAEENGGSFSFEISNRIWSNRIFLPTQKLTSSKKSA